LAEIEFFCRFTGAKCERKSTGVMRFARKTQKSVPFDLSSDSTCTNASKAFPILNRGGPMRWYKAIIEIVELNELNKVPRYLVACKLIDPIKRLRPRSQAAFLALQSCFHDKSWREPEEKDACQMWKSSDLTRVFS
jgi:hypothetical protein